MYCISLAVSVCTGRDFAIGPLNDKSFVGRSGRVQINFRKRKEKKTIYNEHNLVFDRIKATQITERKC